ncbi:Alpha/beta hydrolase [Microterricola viridarii]|uniref:Alpha/beta hydrolase n=1 Tax=Microterricola viridarii TaxID=412690 RepID=A0A1H1TBD4_9MICO|nr:Alpha/beta hydrolase [Microterricola viridarii]
MLAVVMFIASANAALSGVAEGFVMHEPVNVIQNVVSSEPATPLDAGLDRRGPAAESPRMVAFDEAALNRIGGMSLLRGVSQLSPREIIRYAERNPTELDAVRDARIAPSEVGAWWLSTPGQAQAALAEAAPQLLGSLDGVPAAVRGPANERALQRAIVDTRERAASGIGKGERRRLGQQQRMLEAISGALESKPGEPERTLLEFDERESGRAVIVIGDLDTADYISYLVPGMYFSVQQQIRDWTDTAASLAVEQLHWLQDQPQGDGPPRVATVAWLGYQTPDLLTIGSLELAEHGADALESSWQGIRATRGERQPYLTVLAHSYGSTAALIALERHSEQIDALALIGSPGSATQNARDLGVAGDNVFVGEARWDPIVDTAFYGSDPGSPSYGAVRIGVGGGVDPLTQKELAGSVGHNAYFAPGSESQRNLALIGIGRGDWVTDGGTLPPGTMLATAR